MARKGTFRESGTNQEQGAPLDSYAGCDTTYLRWLGQWDPQLRSAGGGRALFAICNAYGVKGDGGLLTWTTFTNPIIHAGSIRTPITRPDTASGNKLRSMNFLQR